MANVVVVGSQWGDEGKGKIVDWLSLKADVVVRFQGGHNAGHTLVIDGTTYKLSLLPSGIVRPGKRSIIGNGVVIDPWALLDEIARIRGQGVVIDAEHLKIAGHAHLILPLHRELDLLREKLAGRAKIGTTGRGIGPAYEDKVGRRGIRMMDLLDEETLDGRLDRLLAHHEPLRRGLGADPIDRDLLRGQLLAKGQELAPHLINLWDEMEKIRIAGHRVLFEGAQGTLLDIDHGTYPFVTSSNTVSGQAANGASVGPSYLSYVLGITKAYTTRVGEGPFPTELFDEVGHRLGERGHEFGTVTGRQRRCGWFDAALVRQSVAINGMQGIALTKLDVLDGFDEVKICTGYRLDGQEVSCLPMTSAAQTRLEPMYETMPGWQESTFGASSFAELPANAVKYVRRIEELIGCPVAMLSTSPERDHTILMRDPFAG